jgi:hypothetical protein
MVRSLTLQELQDRDGTWHRVIQDVCHWCGCSYRYAEDDHDLVWEPGRRTQADCTDELCECHTDAVIGERRD